MLYLKNLKSFINTKRLAIKSFCFLSILLLVFISAIIMIKNDYPENASCTNTINAETNTNFLRTFSYQSNNDNKIEEDNEVLKTSLSNYFGGVFK